MRNILDSILPNNGNISKNSIPTVRTDLNGFSSLANLHSSLRETNSPLIDWSECVFFDANMSAAFVACAEKAFGREVITQLNVKDSVSKTLRRNGFLCRYGFKPLSDSYGTAVELHEITSRNAKEFSQYIGQLFEGKGFPQVTDRLKNRIIQSLMEVVNNSLIHAEATNGIFCCGQAFLQNNSIKLSIVDTGIGIRRKIEKETGVKMNSDMAIEWAIKKGNTTKKGIPGGLGLDFLREFVRLNRGSLLIVSDRGYWSYVNEKASSSRIEKPFPGTAVTITINTADKSSYKLSSE